MKYNHQQQYEARRMPFERTLEPWAEQRNNKIMRRQERSREHARRYEEDDEE
jgi:hypothetical protein